MMKKMILFVAALLLTAGAVQSQVRIGEDKAPEKGAILDLNSTYIGGLLLPNVDITDLEKIPASFTEASVQNQDDNAALTGMIVRNTNTTTGVGIYEWDGSKWNKLTSTAPCTTLATPGAMTLSATTISRTYTFTASVPAVTGATSYIWTLPTGLSGFSNTNTITITASILGTYAAGTIQVEAVNECGTRLTSNSTADVIVYDGTVTGSNRTYKIWCFKVTPGDICWMTENSMEGTSSATSYNSGLNTGRGSYYTLAQATATLGTAACPTGWHLPSKNEWQNLNSYLNSTPDPAFVSEWFDRFWGGNFQITATWNGWDRWASYWTSSAEMPYAYWDLYGAFVLINQTEYWNSVRCVKDN